MAKKSKRTIIPAKGNVSWYMMDKRLDRDGLAAKAGVDIKTVIRADEGKPIYVRNLHKLAQALNQPTQFLLKPIHEDTKNPVIRMTLTFEIPYENLTQKDTLHELLNNIAKNTGMASYFHVLGIRAGSCIITVNVLVIDARRLIAAFLADKLSQFAISAIQVSRPLATVSV